MSNSLKNKRIAKNSVYMSIRLIIVLIITLYTTRRTLEILGVVDYGIYNVVCGFVTMFTFLNTSLSNAIQRFFNYEYGKSGENGAIKVFNSALQIQLILSMLVVVATEIAGVWYLHNKMVMPEDRLLAGEWIFHLSVVSMALLILQAPFTAAIMAHEKMDFYSVISIADAILKLITVFILPLISGDLLIVYGISILLISIFNFLVYFLYAKASFPEICLNYRIDKPTLKSMLSFSGWNMCGSFAGMMREQGVNMVMNVFFGPVVNAARGLAVQVNGALEGFAGNLLTPVRPQVIQSYAQEDYKRAFNLTFTASKLSSFFVVILAVPLCFELDFILHIWLGDDVPDHTAMFVALIIATTILNILMGSMATIVHASGKMMAYQLIGGAIKILPVPVSYIILMYMPIPEYALLCVLVLTFIGYIVGLFIIKKITCFSIKYYLRNVLMPVILLTILLYAFLVPWYSLVTNTILQFFVVMSVGVLTGTCLAYCIGLTNEEKQYIRNFIFKIIKRNGKI